MTLVVSAMVWAAQSFFLRFALIQQGWAVWRPMNGVTLATLLLIRRRHWPWVMLAFGIGIASAQPHLPLRVMLTQTLCDLLEALGPALVLPHFRTMDKWLAQPRLASDFLILAILAAPTAASLLAPLYGHVRPGESYWLAMFRREAADVLGIALFTPLVLALFDPETWSLFRPAALPRTLALFSLVIFASWLVFHRHPMPISFVMYPIILMVGTQLGLSGATIALNLTAGVATWATLHGLGPFSLYGGAEFVRVSYLQFYLILALSMTLPVSVERVRRLTTEAQLKLSFQKMEEFATLDGLTNVANRRRFDEVLRLEWARARRDRSCLALLMIDTDRFKAFNDYYGHLAGDACLRSVAHAIAEVPGRVSDLVARYGGEEFAVLLPGSDAAGACKVAEIIRRNVHALAVPHHSSEEQRVTVSIGVASLVPDSKTEPIDLVAASDYALYQAKHGGRNRIHLAQIRGDRDDNHGSISSHSGSLLG